MTVDTRFTNVDIVNKGPLFDVFRAQLEGRPVYVKCVADREDSVRRTGVGSLWEYGNRTKCFVGSEMGWAKLDGHRPGRAHYESALRAEYEVLRSVGKHWNHPGATLVRQPASGGEACLVMPECQGTSIERFSRQEQRRWIPRMLPALWRALTYCPHGDLSPGDLLIDPSRRFVRILDPGVRINGPQELGPGEQKLFSKLFTTNVARYPLLLPEHGPDRPTLQAPYGGLIRQLDSWWRQLHWWRDTADSAKSMRGKQSDNSASPAAADLVALGAMYAFILAAVRLDELLELEEPLWSRVGERGRLSAVNRGDVTPEPTARERRCVEVIERGELSRVLRSGGATQSEAELCTGLIALHIDSLEELVAYCERV